MAAGEANMFVAADYVVFILSVVVSLMIGVFFAIRGKNDTSTENYFLGNRRLPYLPVALSFLVSFESSILILGFPAEVYAHGMMLVWVNLGLSIAILLSSRITVSMFHPLKITTVFEYFRLRYDDNVVRFFTATTGIVYNLFYMGVVLYGPALAIESVTAIPVWVTILWFAVVSVVYTSIGGIKAVIWTDVFQFIVMSAGILALIIKGSMDAGGFQNVWSIAQEAGRLDVVEFNPDPTIRHTFWTLTIGSISQYVYITLNQTSVQRLNSTPTMSDAKKVLYITIPLFTITQVAAMTQGLVAFGYFTSQGCDPLASGDVGNVNQIVPYTTMTLFRSLPGLCGLFIASLSSASLSTVSSCLSSLSAVTCQDFVRLRLPHLSDATMTIVAKVTVVIYGVLATALAFSMSYIDGPLQQIFISFMGSISGPATGIFILSIFCRRATSKGALVGIIVGTLFSLWISFGYNFSTTLPKDPWLPLGPTDQCMLGNSTTFLYSNYTQGYDVSTSAAMPEVSTEPPPEGAQGLDRLYSVSYMYFSMIGALTTFSVGLVASLVTRQQKLVDDRYVLSFTKQFCCCCRMLAGGNSKDRSMTHTRDNDIAEKEKFFVNSSV